MSKGKKLILIGTVGFILGYFIGPISLPAAIITSLAFAVLVDKSI